MASLNAGQQSGRGQNNSQSFFQTFKSWASWLLSVMFTSALISRSSIGRYLHGSEVSPIPSSGKTNNPATEFHTIPKLNRAKGLNQLKEIFLSRNEGRVRRAVLGVATTTFRCMLAGCSPFCQFQH